MRKLSPAHVRRRHNTSMTQNLRRGERTYFLVMSCGVFTGWCWFPSGTSPASSAPPSNVDSTVSILTEVQSQRWVELEGHQSGSVHEEIGV